jgi:hypothetical protein
MRRYESRSLRRQISLLIAGVLVGLVTPAAQAHSGSRAELFIGKPSAEPRLDGLFVTVPLRDKDSGRPEPGFAVQVEASGPGGAKIGPIQLVDHGTGTYDALLPIRDEGWTLQIRADEAPGGASALSDEKTWQVSGNGEAVAGARPGSSSSSPIDGGLVLASIVGLVVLGGAALFAVRRASTRGRRPASAA